MQQPIYPRLVTDALASVRYPGNGKSVTELNMVEDDIRIDGRNVSFSLIFEKPTDPFIKAVTRAAEAAVKLAAGGDADVMVNTKFLRAPAPKLENPLPGVKNIVAVSSGKGGVGKSTVAANLAVALAAKGYKVGLLDADIFGPSIPKMFGVEDETLYMVNENGRDLIEPIVKYGVKLLSIGFVVPKESAVLWRGGMASNALKQLITDAAWGDLDYFLIDMPPGTSDIHLTLVQTLGISGAIVVSTPQEVALADARKGIDMFTGDKVNVPILGLVENMAWFTPAPHPEERYYIFGNGGGVRLAEEKGVALLGQIPLVADLCTGGDSGCPVSTHINSPESTDPAVKAMAEAFGELAERVAEAVARRNEQLPPTSKVEMQTK